MDLNPSNETKLQVHKNGFLTKVLNSLFSREKTTPVTEVSCDEAALLLQSIKDARRDWISATTNFDYASENEVVDYYAYKIKACEVKYEYLIKKAKEMDIKTELLEAADITIY
jgi:hypothetical protein